MFISRRYLYIPLLSFVVLVALSGSQQGRSALQSQGPRLAVRDPTLPIIHDDTPVVLPKSGKIDERPFFSSSRHPVIEYPDRETTDAVAELAHKVDSGAVRLRFEKDS